MPHTNSYVNPQREGACSQDVWKIYNMLPDNTHFTLEFYYDGEFEEPLETISFLKCGNPLEAATVEDHTDHMKAAFRKYGYQGYRSLQMRWNRGFGNSVLVQVIIYRLE